MGIRKLFERVLLRSSGVGVAPAIEKASFQVKLRPFNRLDSETCRRVDGKPLIQNPGIRVSSNYISEQEAAALVQCAMELKQGYGFRSSEAQDVLAIAESSTSSGSSSAATALGIQVRAERVTGRPELPHQRHAPWGYGDGFRRHLVPDALRQLADRIAADGDFGLHAVDYVNDLKDQNRGPQLRDITINYRDEGMFKLDPHCDPPEDGENIFIVGLLSDVVLTFTPPSDVDVDGSGPAGTDNGTTGTGSSGRHGGLAGASMSVRTTPAAIALRSWTDADIDVCLRQHWLVHFTGEARYPWRHAIRTGVDVGEPYNGICDWWGDLNTLVRRQPQRISLIFAFA